MRRSTASISSENEYRESKEKKVKNKLSRKYTVNWIKAVSGCVSVWPVLMGISFWKKSRLNLNLPYTPDSFVDLSSVPSLLFSSVVGFCKVNETSNARFCIRAFSTRLEPASLIHVARKSPVVLWIRVIYSKAESGLGAGNCFELLLGSPVSFLSFLVCYTSHISFLGYLSCIPSRSVIMI